MFTAALFKTLGFPGGSDGKASASNAGDRGLIPGLGRSPGEGNGNPLQFLPGKSHGGRSLVGYNPRGHKESDTTEQLHFTSEQIILKFAWKLNRSQVARSILIKKNKSGSIPFTGFNYTTKLQ